jgi:hypothetical protein
MFTPKLFRWIFKDFKNDVAEIVLANVLFWVCVIIWPIGLTLLGILLLLILFDLFTVFIIWPLSWIFGQFSKLFRFAMRCAAERKRKRHTAEQAILRKKYEEQEEAKRHERLRALFRRQMDIFQQKKNLAENLSDPDEKAYMLAKIDIDLREALAVLEGAE